MAIPHLPVNKVAKHEGTEQESPDRQCAHPGFSEFWLAWWRFVAGEEGFGAPATVDLAGIKFSAAVRPG
jgi:hypothetical protein